MNARRHRSSDGFTIVELLAVMGVIAALIALILPAVMQARESARRSQCQNNLRNLGVAMINATSAQVRFPASGYFTIKNSNVVPSHNWVVNLLGYLDRQDIYNQWDFNETLLDPPNDALARLQLNVLICPADITTIGSGDLSYVVNGGFGTTSIVSGVADCPCDSNGMAFDFNGNGIRCPPDVSIDGKPGDKDVYFATGMFFLESFRVPGTVRHHTLDDVIDGLSQTIIIGENARVGFNPFAPSATWAAAAGIRNSFFLPGTVCNNGTCSIGNVDYTRANQGATAINAGLSVAEGEAPWPNSFHPGGVHFVFGDGHVKFISQQINGAIYASLISPQGIRVVGPLAQIVVSDSDY